MLRLLWSSNSPFCPTGYGIQTAIATQHLKKMGHEVAIFAFYGLEGSQIDWMGIPIYPNNPRDWGQTDSYMFYQHFKADIYLTLVDAWVLKGLDIRMNWVPWMPVDHDPVSDAVVRTLNGNAGLVKPIAMARFGQEKLREKGIESYYIPHSIDTNIYRPDAEARKDARKMFNWQDKFVIGTVGTNHGERKNWITSLKAVKKLSEMHPSEIIYYMHTDPVCDRGINLAALRENLKMEDMTFFPSKAGLTVGIEPEAMARAYNAMDVFLLLSKGEGFGIPLVEAQACGTPIVTTKCTAQTELMGGGWFVENLIQEWTGQASWQFECTVEEAVERLEQAYQAKKSGRILEEAEKAHKKGIEYSNERVFSEYWPPVLKDIEERIKRPKSLEGVQQWRLGFIPRNCIPRKVLDIGCGVTQPYRTHLEHLGDYVGIDTKNGPGVKRMDAHKLTFRDKEFGFVWMSEVLEHVKDPARVLAEAQRVGVHGVCLFSTPMNPFFKMDTSHKEVNLPYATLKSGDGMITW